MHSLEYNTKINDFQQNKKKKKNSYTSVPATGGTKGSPNMHTYTWTHMRMHTCGCTHTHTHIMHTHMYAQTG